MLILRQSLVQWDFGDIVKARGKGRSFPAIEAKDTGISKILENFALATPTVVEYMNKKVDRIKGEIAEFNEKIVKLEANKSNRKQIDTETLENIFKQWHKVSKEDKQKIADILITKVLVSKTKIESVWKVQFNKKF